MKRYIMPVCALMCTLAIGIGVKEAGSRYLAPSRVYTLAQVETGLAQNPTAWLRRRIRVHATPTAIVCFPSPHGPSCPFPDGVLVDADGSSLTAPLPLALGSLPAGLALLRHVPLLNAFAPATQTIRWALPGIYRIEIQVSRCSAPGPLLCYTAMIPDAVR